MPSDTFIQFVERYFHARDPLVTSPAGGPGIVVTPWMRTPVPWYSLAIALMYRERGLAPTIIWDDLPVHDEASHAQESAEIERVLASLRGRVPVIRLSRSASQPLTPLDQTQVARQARENAIRESLDSLHGDALARAAAVCQEKLQHNLGKIKGLFADQAFAHLVVPGGVYANSGLFAWEAQSRGIRPTTYDGDRGEIWTGVTSPAAHQMDVRQLLDHIQRLSLSDEAMASLVQLAQREYEARKSATDSIEFQAVASTGDGERFDVLIPLNIFWDTAALGKESLFANRMQWLEETVDYILSQTSATVAIREHPSQRIYPAGPQLGQFLRQRFERHPRFRFIGCHERVNTYDLLAKTSVVLPFTSTVGIEAAAMGKVVLMESDAYYANQSFVERAFTRSEYFAKIRAALEQGRMLSREQQDQAWIAYLASQLCGRVFTHFTPHPDDFERWSRQSVEELLADPEVALFIDGLISGRPPAIALFERLRARQLPTLAASPDHASVSPSRDAGGEPLEALKRKGLAAFAAGDLSGANEAFQRVLARDRQDLDALISLGDLALSEQRHADALGYFHSAVTVSPQEVDALAGVILAARESGARQILSKAIVELREFEPAHPVLAEPAPAAAHAPAAPQARAASRDLEDYFPQVTFGDGVQLLGVRNIAIRPGSCIGDQVWLNICERDEHVRMTIGEAVLVGRQSMISTGGMLEIGAYCVFAPRVYISDADHVFSDISQPIIQQGATLGRRLVVEENCWFGINVVVSGSLTVGRGSVIAANSVVTKDVPPFAVMAGNPAQVIKLYNPRTQSWERVRSPEDHEAILADRAAFGLPSREAYQQILQQNSFTRQIDPIVAGRGEHIW